MYRLSLLHTFQDLLQLIGSLNTHIFETWTTTGIEDFACKEVHIFSQIFTLLISNEEKILSNVNMVVWGQLKSENSSLPVTVRASKTHVLKFPIVITVPTEEEGERQGEPYKVTN